MNINKDKKRYRKDLKKSFGNLYRKCLQDNVVDKNEFEYISKFFKKYVNEKEHGYYF